MISDADFERSVDKTPDFGDGKTAFKPTVLFGLVNGGEHFFTGFDNTGINENFNLVVNDCQEKTLVQADLGGGQADALGIGGVIEDFDHFSRLFGGFFVPGGQGFGPVVEERMGGGEDFHNN